MRRRPRRRRGSPAARRQAGAGGRSRAADDDRIRPAAGGPPVRDRPPGTCVSQRGGARRRTGPVLTLGTVISRIDLRGSAFDAAPHDGGIDRDLLPRAELDVEAALEKVRPICEAVRHRGTAALIEYARGSTASPSTGSGCPARRCGRAGRAGPGGPGRAGGVDPPGPRSCTASSAAPTTPPASSPAAP